MSQFIVEQEKLIKKEIEKSKSVITDKIFILKDFNPVEIIQIGRLSF